MITSKRTLGQVLRAALGGKRAVVRDERGSAAIEFALLALPFFAIIGAILETALVFLASQVLDSAVHDSARLIRTGRAHTASYTVTEYRAAICEGLYGLFDCAAVKIKVAPISAFSAAAIGNTVDPTDGSWTIAENYNHGAGSSIVLVEAYYKWPTYMDLFGFNLASLPDNTRLLSAVRLFRNEPF